MWTLQNIITHAVFSVVTSSSQESDGEESPKKRRKASSPPPMRSPPVEISPEKPVPMVIGKVESREKTVKPAEAVEQAHSVPEVDKREETKTPVVEENIVSGRTRRRSSRMDSETKR